VTVAYGLSGVEGLGTIALGELEALAELQTRRDRKYLVPRDRVDALLMGADARALTIAGACAFHYQSTYFDTPELSSYLAAARRRPHRFKIRIRTYLDSDVSALEVKTRDARGRTVKHRTPHDVARTNDPTHHGRRFIESLVPAAACADLQPTLITAYTRATLVATSGDSRITIDVDLAWEHPDGRRLELPDVALIETKSPGPPSRFDRHLWRAGHRPVTISKYCTGLAALTPAVPANKWHRVLQEHFPPRLRAAG